MTVSVAVMSHPKRAARLGALRDAISDLAVAVDPEPDRLGQWSSARRAWLMYDSRATHHCVIEDDAVPCAAFTLALERLVVARTERMISLWANSRLITDALAVGKTLVQAPRQWFGAVGIVMPIGWCDAFVAFGNARDRSFAEFTPSRATYEPNLREFLSVSGERLLWTAPSLVEHGEPEDSLLWGRKVMPKRRVANLFIGNTVFDPLTIEWTGDGEDAQVERCRA